MTFLGFFFGFRPDEWYDPTGWIQFGNPPDA